MLSDHVLLELGHLQKSHKVAHTDYFTLMYSHRKIGISVLNRISLVFYTSYKLNKHLLKFVVESRTWLGEALLHLRYVSHLHLHSVNLLRRLLLDPGHGLLGQDVVHHLHDALIRQRRHRAFVGGLHRLHGLHRLLGDQHRLQLLGGGRVGGPELGWQVGGQDADGVLHLGALVVELQGVLLQHDLPRKAVHVVLGHVLAQRARVDMRLLAHRAHVRPLARVSPDVAFERAGVGPGHATGQTFKRLHS